MDRRQRNFLLVVAGLVILFVLVLFVLSRVRQQTIPGPTLTPVIPSPTVGTPVVPPTSPATPPVVATTPAAPVVSPSPAPGTATPTPAPMVFYVSPDGSANGDGSQARPWSLQAALNQPDAVKPGATIWLKGGQYIGTFTCQLNGADGKPITVRAMPGQRVTLEANNDLVLDIASSSYVDFWGLEITTTQNPRDPKNNNESAYGVRINQGKPSHEVNFINMIVHDMPAQGFGWWQALSDSEIYGSLVYFNGVTQFDHGIYVHNTDGKKVIEDNLIFDNASHGIHAYGEKDYQKLNNITVEGNTVFDNGSIGYNTKSNTWGGYKRNILVGGLQVAENPVIVNNYTYFPNNNDSAESLNLGYRAGSVNAVVENNYLVGGSVTLGGQNVDLTALKNTILGLVGLPQLNAGSNQFMLFKPADPKIFVRPNKYEAGRANITVYNWSKQTQVTLTADDLKGVQIKAGDHYQLHNAQDYFGDVLTGTYDGQQINVPMTNHSVAQPLGLNFKPASTFPEFGSFVLEVVPQN